MSDWGKLVEDRIQEAMEAGAFDDLPGKGQPLRLDEHAHEESGKRTAHRLLRSSGFTLPWIDERRGIEADVEAALADLNRSWAWVQDQSDGAWAEDAWERALQTFQAQAVKLNRRVRDYNLKTPNLAFQLPHLDAQREIANLTS